MKKILSLILIAGLVIVLIAGCGGKQEAPSGESESQGENESKVSTIKVGATPVPHAEVLNVVKPILEKEGINLEIIEFTDYNQPNLRLADKDLDANYFQHIPYFEDFSENHNLDLTYTAKVHIEPMGIYSKKIKDLNELKDGATVAIPNDATNGGRALLLLQSAGIIKLEEGAGVDATVANIAENPKKIKCQA